MKQSNYIAYILLVGSISCGRITESSQETNNQNDSIGGTRVLFPAVFGESLQVATLFGRGPERSERALSAFATNKGALRSYNHLFGLIVQCSMDFSHRIRFLVYNFQIILSLG